MPAGSRGRAWLRWGVSFGAVLAVHIGVFVRFHHETPAMGVPAQTAMMMDMAPEPVAAPAALAPPVAHPTLPQPPPPMPAPDNLPPLRQVAVPLPRPLPHPHHALSRMRPALPVARRLFRRVSPSQAAAMPARPAPSAPPAPPAVRQAATPADRRGDAGGLAGATARASGFVQTISAGCAGAWRAGGRGDARHARPCRACIVDVAGRKLGLSGFGRGGRFLDCACGAITRIPAGDYGAPSEFGDPAALHPAVKSV